MKRYVVLIGNAVEFTRHEEADTLAGIKRKQSKAQSDGYKTVILDTSITTTDSFGDLYYANIDCNGTPGDWRLAASIK